MHKTIKITKDIKIGGKSPFVIMAGPCAAESEEQVLKTATAVKKAGAHIFRASLYKPRTTPDSYQGCGEIGFAWLKRVKQELKMPVMIEVRTVEHILLALKHKIDIMWIGARNSQNFDLLIDLGKLTKDTDTPILLKRGASLKLKEWLGAAEYIRKSGNPNVILCERGIIGFDQDTTRNMLDLQTALIAKKESGLPVVIDPSHAAGRRDLIVPMSLASKACGLDGLLVEVHCNPDEALTDKDQQIGPKAFSGLMKELSSIPNNK